MSYITVNTTVEIDTDDVLNEITTNELEQELEYRYDRSTHAVKYEPYEKELYNTLNEIIRSNAYGLIQLNERLRKEYLND